jgi:hypothetical protein
VPNPLRSHGGASGRDCKVRGRCGIISSSRAENRHSHDPRSCADTRSWGRIRREPAETEIDKCIGGRDRGGYGAAPAQRQARRSARRLANETISWRHNGALTAAPSRRLWCLIRRNSPSLAFRSCRSCEPLGGRTVRAGTWNCGSAYLEPPPHFRLAHPQHPRAL